MKKSLSVALVVAMVSSMFASMAFADDASTTPAAPLTAQQKYDALAAKGILDGTDSGADLNGLTTRAQIAKILTVAFGLTQDASSASVYKDLDGAGWAAGYIGAVTKAGLMDGVADGKFDPSSNVSLEQVATVLVRAFKLDTTSTDVGNATVDGWAKGYVAAAIKAGLVSASTDFTTSAKRSDLVYSAYVAVQGADVVKLTADKWEVVDSKNVKVTFSDGTSQTYPLATALVAGQATPVTISYKGKDFMSTVTLPVAAEKIASVMALSNTKVNVSLSGAVTSVNAADFALNGSLTVSSATLSSDGKTVTLVTSAQTPGTAYTVTANGTTGTWVGLPVDKTALNLSSVVSRSNTIVEVTFDNTDADPATLLNPANYTFDNSLTASAVAYKNDENGNPIKGDVYVTTSSQTGGTVYTLTVKNIADYSGNVIDSSKTMQFAGQPKDTSAPTLGAVTSSKGNTVVVNFNDASQLDASILSNAATYSIDGGVTVSSVDVNANPIIGGAIKVTLHTSNQTAGTVYTLTVKGIKDVYGNTPSSDLTQSFAGSPLDTTPPSVQSAVSTGNKSIDVTFNDTVDKATATDIANYSFDNNLKPVSATLDSNGTTVHLVTAAQTSGTVYTLTVSNVKDSSGNAITTSQTYKYSFAGRAALTTAPTATISSGSANQVTITFSATMDDASVQTLTNYSFNGNLGYPTGIVSWNAATKTLVLSTANQTAGQVYALTISNVKDVDGNVYDSSKTLSFAGVGNSLDALNVTSVVALNSRQVQVNFNKDVQKSNWTPTIFDSKNNQVAVVGYAYRSNSKTYIVTTATDMSNDIYTLTVPSSVEDYGSVGINTVSSANVKTFGGVTSARTAITATAVQEVTPTSVQVFFSEPVNVASSFNKSLFSVQDASGNTIASALAGDVTGSVYKNQQYVVTSDNKSIIVTLDKALPQSAVVKLVIGNGFLAGITDKTGGQFSLVADSGAATITRSFGTLATTAAQVKLNSAVGIDSNTVELTFSQPVNFNNMNDLYAPNVPANLFTFYDSNGTALTNQPTVTYVARQGDWTKLRVYFQPGTTTFNAANGLYEVNVTNSTYLSGIDGTALTAVAPVAFGYVQNATIAAPSLVAATPMSNSSVNVAFNATLNTNATAADFTINDITDPNAPVNVAITAVQPYVGDTKTFTLIGGANAFQVGHTYQVVVNGSTTLMNKYRTVYVKTGTDNAITFAGANHN